jgi:hypothetical protein
MTPVVGFELPISEVALYRLLEEEGLDEAESSNVLPRVLEPALVEEIEAELIGVNHTIVTADSGRGADAYPVALEILSFVADFGGAVATLAGGVALTRRIHRWLQQRLGHRVKVSLGAACFLAAADLEERRGEIDFYFHGGGDTRNRPHDFSYSGNDCFYVIFERKGVLYFYAVDAYGVVTALGEARMPPLYE